MSVLSPNSPPDETTVWDNDLGDEAYGLPLGRSEFELEGPSTRTVAALIGAGALLVLFAIGLGFMLLGSDDQAVVSQPGDPAAGDAEVLQSDSVNDGSGAGAGDAAEFDPQAPSTDTVAPTTATTQALVIEESTVPASSSTAAPSSTVTTAAPATTASTAAPSTSAPSSSAPTTAAPTTAAPATTAPTTAPPTTAAPTTAAPTTAAPTTAAPTTAAPTTAAPAPAPAGDDTAKQQAILALVNAERSAAGCGALTLQSQLNAAADAHSEDMAARVYFDHTGLDGSQPWDRAARFGYGGGFIGENIAQGYGTEASVMEGWMNSPGHRANILNCNYTHLGVGFASGQRPNYWTQLFGAGG